MKTQEAVLSANVHPTAVIEKGAEIGSDCIIGPFCHIGSDVKLGDTEFRSKVNRPRFARLGAEHYSYRLGSFLGPWRHWLRCSRRMRRISSTA